MIVIIDYGLGNLASVKNMLKKVGVESIISNKEEDILNAEKLVLPGVGHFAKGMQELVDKSLINILNKRVIEDKIPILGICLGMQLMTNYSEEGDVKGLGWIDAETVKFNIENPKLKIPHMGWADVNFTNSAIFDELPRFYFVHSYKVICNNAEDVLGRSEHGGKFHCAFKKNNIWGVQFHPEKSHKFGKHFLKHFFELKD